jgi:hypothetical protein
MGKLLPVERSSSPYRYISENFEAVGAEFEAEIGQAGNGAEGLLRLQLLLTRYEVLGALRRGFVANGWSDEKCVGEDTLVLES